MDLNLTDFDVVSEKIKLNQKAEIPLDADIALADYEPSAAKVFRCKINAYVSSKNIIGNGVNIEGTANITVIYCDEDNNIFAAEKEMPFKKSVEAPFALDGGNAEVTLTPVTQSFKAVTERKISIKATLNMDIKVTDKEINSVISNLEDEDFETLCGSTKAVIPIGKAEKFFIIDEELNLKDTSDSIEKIIFTHHNADISETKILNNKIVVKGNLNIELFYRTTNNTYEDFNTKLPFNQIIDFNGVGEDCNWDAGVEISNINVTARTSQNGECKTVMLVAKLCVSANAFCEKDIPLVYDLYSKNYETEIEREEICFNKVIHKSKESFICKKSISLPENSLGEVIKLWCESGKCINKITEQGLTICGNITVCTFVKENSGNIVYVERDIDFDYPINLNEKLNSPICTANAEILNTNFTVISGGNIEISMELEISSSVYDHFNISAVSKINIDESKRVSNKTSIFAYYAEKGENVWEISKNFLADRKSFLEINELQGETVLTPAMLIIPRI